MTQSKKFDPHFLSGFVSSPGGSAMMKYGGNMGIETKIALSAAPIAIGMGNTRVTFNSGGIIQEDSYYPYGMTMSGLSEYSGIDLPNKYRYNAVKPSRNFGIDFIVFRAFSKSYKNRRFSIFRDGKIAAMEY